MALTQLGRDVVAGRVAPARTAIDWEFIKTVALELVFAWEDARRRGPARAALERVMCNVGVERDDDGSWTLATPGGGRLVLNSRR